MDGSRTAPPGAGRGEQAPIASVPLGTGLLRQRVDVLAAFGSLGPALAARSPVTVRVVVPHQARAIAFLPLELEESRDHHDEITVCEVMS